MFNYNVYLRGMRQTFKEFKEYKFNLFGDILLMPIMVFIWVFVYFFLFNINNTTTLGGLTLNEGISYMIIVSMISYIYLPVWISGMVMRDIITGDLVNYIMRPISHFFWHFSISLIHRIFRSIVAIIVYLVLMFSFPEFIFIPKIGNVVLSISVLLLAYFALFQLFYLIGLLSFWISDISVIQNLVNIIQGIFGGRYFPLKLFPTYIINITKFSVFPILFSLPSLIIIDDYSIPNILQSFYVLIIWIIVFSLLINKIWNIGIRRFEGYGN